MHVRVGVLLPLIALVAIGCGDATPTGALPSATPSPASPTLVATASPSPSAVASADSVDCARPLQALVDDTPEGGTLDVTGCTFTAGATIPKPLTIVGLRLDLPIREDSERYSHELEVKASDVTFQGLVSRGGANIIAIEGPYARTRILDADIRDQIGSAVWIKGAATDTLIERATVVTRADYAPSSEPGVSPIRAEGCLDPWPCDTLARGTVVRDSFVDQGPRYPNGPGWFGIEMIRAPEAIIERTTVRGGHTRISLANSDGSQIRENVIDLREGGVWGVEVAGSLDVVITGNTFDGAGEAHEDSAAVSFNATSGRTPTGVRVTSNTIRGLDAAFQLSGDALILTDNCVADLRTIYYEYGGPIGPDVTLERNAACSVE